MSNNPAKYEVLAKQYLRSVLDISENFTVSFVKVSFSFLDKISLLLYGSAYVLRQLEL